MLKFRVFSKKDKRAIAPNGCYGQDDLYCNTNETTRITNPHKPIIPTSVYFTMLFKIIIVISFKIISNVHNKYEPNIPIKIIQYISITPVKYKYDSVKLGIQKMIKILNRKPKQPISFKMFVFPDPSQGISGFKFLFEKRRNFWVLVKFSSLIASTDTKNVPRILKIKIAILIL
jgi:hypothetical protein